MDNFSQFELIGALVIGLGVLIVFVKYFIDFSDGRNKLFSEMKQNLLENTLMLKSLKEYLKRVETETKAKLDEHEKRLDEHSEAIIKLNSFKDIQINGDKKE